MARNSPKKKDANKGIIRRISEAIQGTRVQIQEIIGRISYRAYNEYFRTRPTVDYTQADYEWYDKFRRGKQSGYEIGGLFANPIANIISSWSLSDGFSIDTESDDTQDALNDFLQRDLQTLIETSEDSLSLGDAYIVVNADGSLTKISPEQVKITRSDVDIHDIQAVTILTVNEGVEIEDIYMPNQRIVRIKRNGQLEEQIFPNLIGRIPVVQWSNDLSPNEVYGHPYVESLLTLFAEYDDVMRKGIDGVKIMGNPIPVVEGLEDPEAAKQLNASYTDTYVDNEGNTQTEYVTELSPNEIMFFGSGANFKFASPQSFTDNTTAMLKKLFYVMLQHAKIPEWVWGGAISSSMASVEAQTPAFIKFIEGRRRKMERPIKALLEIYFAIISLFTPNIDTNSDFNIEWKELMPVDKALLLQWVQWMQSQGIMSNETALRLSDVVKDVQAEIDKAQQELADRQAKQLRQQNRAQMLDLRNQINNASNQANNMPQQPPQENIA